MLGGFSDKTVRVVNNGLYFILFFHFTFILLFTLFRVRV